MSFGSLVPTYLTLINTSIQLHTIAIIWFFSLQAHFKIFLCEYISVWDINIKINKIIKETSILDILTKSNKVLVSKIIIKQIVSNVASKSMLIINYLIGFENYSWQEILNSHQNHTPMFCQSLVFDFLLI
jgi:hypothetical protein